MAVKVDEKAFPLTMTSLLRSLSNVDIDFSNTVESIAELRSKLRFPSFGGGFLDYLVTFFKWFYKVVTGIFKVPFDIVKDLLDFCASVISFFTVLIGG